MNPQHLPGQDGRVAELLVTNGELRERVERLAAALHACVLELEWFRPTSLAVQQGRATLRQDMPPALSALSAGLTVTELGPGAPASLLRGGL